MDADIACSVDGMPCVTLADLPKAGVMTKNSHAKNASARRRGDRAKWRIVRVMAKA
jgi:hypothetical protein